MWLEQLLRSSPWWAVVLVTVAIAWGVSRRIGLSLAMGLLLCVIGVLGLWDAGMQTLAVGVLAKAPGFSLVENGRFKGGYVTRHYGDPRRGVHALQLEVAQACYMDESAPFRYDPARAAPLAALLERLVIALSEWRP